MPEVRNVDKRWLSRLIGSGRSRDVPSRCFVSVDAFAIPRRSNKETRDCSYASELLRGSAKRRNRFDHEYWETRWSTDTSWRSPVTRFDAPNARSFAEFARNGRRGARTWNDRDSDTHTHYRRKKTVDLKIQLPRETTRKIFLATLHVCHATCRR